jgi:PEBP family protein
VPAKTTEITGESLPTGAVEGVTSWGKPGWGGPQPPFGTHRYQFYVYALNTVLDLPGNTKPKELIATMKPHIVEQAVLTGKFGVLDILRHG